MVLRYMLVEPFKSVRSVESGVWSYIIEGKYGIVLSQKL